MFYGTFSCCNAIYRLLYFSLSKKYIGYYTLTSFGISCAVLYAKKIILLNFNSFLIHLNCYADMTILAMEHLQERYALQLLSKNLRMWERVLICAGKLLLLIFFSFSMFQPSEFDTYADIEAVYDCLQIEYGISQEDLILYGQSVGSGPTLHLAAKLPRLRGVVLHSGILSGLRVLCHANFTFCFDIYKVTNTLQGNTINFLMSFTFFVKYYSVNLVVVFE